MKLRFIFLTALLATLMARGAVPSYNGTTLVVSPTNLHRSNFLDSATLTWTKDQFGRLTPNVIGGASSNAQPPNVTLTNLSGIVTQQLAFTNTASRGRQLFVDSIHGDNATGTRGRADKPFADPVWAKTNAAAGDTIVVRPGVYGISTNHNLAKNGVNWYYYDGAIVVRDGGGLSLSEQGIYHDHGAGAMQFSVSGYGEIIVSNGYSLCLAFTNRSSRVNVVAKRLWNKSGGPLIYHAESDLNVFAHEFLRADNYDVVWSQPTDGATSMGSLYVDAPYWYAGDNLVECYTFATNGACVLSARSAESQTLNSGATIIGGSNVVVRFGTVRTTGLLSTQGTGYPEYDIRYLEIVGNPSVPPISIGVWLRNCFVYSPGTTTPVRASSGASGPVRFDNVSIHTGADTWVEGFGGAGGYVTNNGFFQVNGKLPASDVRVISRFAQGVGFSITNQVGALTLHETNGTFAVGLKAADNLTNNFTLILPTNHPAVGQVLSVRAVSGQNYSLTWSNDSGSAVTGPYILFTNGHGTNTSFWDGVKVDADGMTNAGPYRGRYVLSDLSLGVGASVNTGTNISALNTWDESDGEFTAASVHIVDSSTAGQGAALLRLYTDPQGTHLYHWLVASNAQSAASYRLLTDGSSHQSGNANVKGTLSTTNLVITNRVTHAVKTLAFSGTNVTVDFSQGNCFNLLATNNFKLWFTNAPGAGWEQPALINVKQDGSGSRIGYWDSTNIATNGDSGFVFSTAANSRDKIYVSLDETGTNFLVLLNKGFQK